MQNLTGTPVVIGWMDGPNGVESAARVIGTVPQIGAWAGFCSNGTVSGRVVRQTPTSPISPYFCYNFRMKRLLPIPVTLTVLLVTSGCHTTSITYSAGLAGGNLAPCTGSYTKNT